MEKIKTPITQMIEKCKEKLSREEALFKQQGYQNLYLDGQILVLKWQIEHLKQLIKIERDMIEKAFDNGYSNGYSNGICCDLDENTHTDKVSDSSVYFTQTFESYG